MRDNARFTTSSFCSNAGCLGVAETADGVELVTIGDSATVSLHVTREEWAAFVEGVKAGEFDLD